jgi:hypothetical protein
MKREQLVHFPLAAHDDGPDALAGVVQLITRGHERATILVPRGGDTLVQTLAPLRGLREYCFSRLSLVTVLTHRSYTFALLSIVTIKMRLVSQ